ncbi:hypothetical protein HY837_00115 [archaeon]|nr:hypothetical protein [archaeon]
MPPIMYNIVSFCKLCRKRMVQPKGQTTWYCSDCENTIKKSKAREEKEEKAKGEKNGQERERGSKSKKSILRKKTSRKRR